MSEAPTPPPTTPHTPPMPVPAPTLGLTRTTLGRKWLVKMGIFLIVLLGFGVWGLADALYFYPKRGLLDASAKLRDVMASAQEIGQLGSGTIRIPEPRARLKELETRDQPIRAALVSGGPGAGAARLELAQLEYLRSLSRVWQLDTRPKLVHERDGTRIFYEPGEGAGYSLAPDGVRTPLTASQIGMELKAKWDASKTTTPLSGFDMALQWIFAFIGLVGAAYLIFVLLRASRTVYRWEPATQTLTFPKGTPLAPADLKELDKRKWHKYFVTVIAKNGESHELDLLRFHPLEDWVLAMERTAFPEQAVAKERGEGVTGEA